MANRHDRRRRAKMDRMETIRVDDILAMGSMCAWDGCHATTTDPDKEGWSKMVLYTGETQANFLDIDPRRMARDCVLCLEHARHLDEHLLIDIGGQLRQVEGTA